MAIQSCVFCEHQQEKSCIVKNKLARLIVNKKKMSCGHLLVVLNKKENWGHKVNFADLEKEEWKAIVALLKEGVAKLSQHKEIVGFHINHNAGGYASVNHAHFHIVPKYKDGSGFVCDTHDWKAIKNYKFLEKSSEMFANWVDWFDEIKNHIKENNVKQFNIFARIGEVDGKKYQHDHLHFIPYPNPTKYSWGSNYIGEHSNDEQISIAQEIKEGRFGSVDKPNNPNNPNGNCKDNKEFEFLSEILYNFAGLNENNLNQIYNNWPVDIHGLLKNREKLENYRNEMIKNILEKKSASASSDKIKILKKQIWARFDSDNYLSKNKTTELKEILEVKNDESTDNPNKNNDNNKLPVSDTNNQKDTETVEETRNNAKQYLKKLFKKNKTKPNDLAKLSWIWNNQKSWESYLKELKTSQKISEFTQLLTRKLQEKQQITNPPSKPNSSSKILIFLLGGTLLIIFFGSPIIKIWRRKRIKK